MTGNFAEAEDLTQQAFLQVYKKLDTFRGESLLLHLVAPAGRQHGFDAPAEKASVLKEDSLEELTDPDKWSSVWHGRDVRLSAAAPLLAIERMDTERALNQLPMGFRTILILHDIEGYRHVEISALLGCSIGTSKSQLSRARLRIRQLMRSATCQTCAAQ